MNKLIATIFALSLAVTPALAQGHHGGGGQPHGPAPAPHFNPQPQHFEPRHDIDRHDVGPGPRNDHGGGFERHHRGERFFVPGYGYYICDNPLDPRFYLYCLDE